MLASRLLYSGCTESHKSMNAAGRCADDAAADSFFGVLKREGMNRQHYQIRAGASVRYYDVVFGVSHSKQKVTYVSNTGISVARG